MPRSGRTVMLMLVALAPSAAMSQSAVPTSRLRQAPAPLRAPPQPRSVPASPSSAHASATAGAPQVSSSTQLSMLYLRSGVARRSEQTQQTTHIMGGNKSAFDTVNGISGGGSAAPGGSSPTTVAMNPARTLNTATPCKKCQLPANRATPQP